jgi:hypothetical protein
MAQGPPLPYFSFVPSDILAHAVFVPMRITIDTQKRMDDRKFTLMLDGLNKACLVADTEILDEFEAEFSIGTSRTILELSGSCQDAKRVLIGDVREGSIVVDCLVAILTGGFIWSCLKGPWEKSQTKVAYDTLVAGIIDKAADKISRSIKKERWNEKGLVLKSVVVEEGIVSDRVALCVYVEFRRMTPTESAVPVPSKDKSPH